MGETRCVGITSVEGNHINKMHDEEICYSNNENVQPKFSNVKEGDQYLESKGGGWFEVTIGAQERIAVVFGRLARSVF